MSSLLCPDAFLSPLEIDEVVIRALAEDLGRAGDVTSTATIPETAQARAIVVARSAGTIAGLPMVAAAFRKLAPDVEIKAHARDGAQLFVDATVTPLRDGSVTTGAVVALRDITARKRAEAALERQAADLERQFEEAQALSEELTQTNDDLQQALAAAARSEARYRALIEASAHIVWRTDPLGRIAELPEWQVLTGQS